LKSGKKIVFFILPAICFWLIITGAINSGGESSALRRAVPFLKSSGSCHVQDSVKYRFVGIEKCASVCHNNDKMGFQYNIVMDGPHSNAFGDLLSEKAKTISVSSGINGEPADNAICLKCHITGGGLDSSIFAPTYRKEEGITCEACHKGAYKAKTYIPQEADCLICHNNSVHEIPVFNYKENCLKIAHPRPKKV
jgi:hypothetical protein